ncbi:MAG: 3-dehydroquinate synthase [Bernardetiaceae bacterium]|jgi:3-dehydroquinate synthase|nr:3-dehydroquinate synthase [Bernardetiaceae bacterium]
MSSTLFFAPVAESLRQLPPHTQLAVIVDDQTLAHCYPRVRPHLGPHRLVQISAGEEHKHLATCQQVWQRLTEARLDRKALVINLGGGVIGDLGGFCAATYKRGLRFVQMPTTLLAQVDASVGGKLGVDFMGFKNHIGVFQEPAQVHIDPAFLTTLPVRELRSGFAEVIKHCLIADRPAWEQLRQRPLAAQNWAELVPHSVHLKAAVVAQDPTEQGHRKILNFGHTVGHAVESWFLENRPGQRLLHGEAIAIGMVAEAWLSWQKGHIPAQDYLDIRHYLLAIYGHVALPAAHLSEMAELARQDKKNEGDLILASLLHQVGQCGYDLPITRPEIVQSLLAYHQLD